LEVIEESINRGTWFDDA